jgi:hypothetical protein
MVQYMLFGVSPQGPWWVLAWRVGLAWAGINGGTRTLTDETDTNGEMLLLNTDRPANRRHGGPRQPTKAVSVCFILFRFVSVSQLLMPDRGPTILERHSDLRGWLRGRRRGRKAISNRRILSPADRNQ